MRNPALQDQIAFLREVEKLKAVTRANRTVDGRFENSAEHSWHVALMAILLQEHASTPLDMFKVVRMLLIHDIVEIDAGDTFLFAEDQSHKLEAETAAAERLFALLPAAQREDYIALWREFEHRTSDEAKFAAVIDGLQPMLNHVVTGRPEDGILSVDQVLAKKAYIQDFASDLWPLVEALLEESVHKGLYRP